MKGIFLLSTWICLLQITRCSDPELEEEELRARDFMTIFNKESEEEANIQNNIEWDYTIDMSEENLKKKMDILAKNSAKAKKLWKELIKFNWRSFSDPDLKRQFMLESILGLNALPEEDIERISRVTVDMQKVFSNAKICDYKNRTKCDLVLNPNILTIHARSRDEEELKYVWTSYRDAIGPHIRHIYKEYVDLYNKGAKMNNFESADKLWLFPYEQYEIKDIRTQFQRLWEQVKPLYQQLHAFMRFKLRQVYGDIVSEKGPIPAHLLGDVYGQAWDVGYDFIPFPNADEQGVTSNLMKQNYTVDKMFHTAEEFFLSIGLSPMTKTFWKKSVFEKIPDKEMECHATAWDFHNKEDFRIRMCTSINEGSFFNVHHEMGHIEYFMEFKDQPYPFRAGANPGFHEAIGDLIALSVQSPKHLALLRLSNARHDDKEVILNNLYKIGLHKISYLPYAYSVDLWRWGAFSGNISFEDYNCKWWELRENLQGLEPPVPRTETDFDIASKFHIPNSMPFIRYFVAIILEFQIHRALCEKSGEYDPDDPKKPLHMCDIHNKKEAGRILKDMLKMGSSKPWPEVLHVATGQRYMDASAILEYFRPLQSWLERENRKNDVHVGWEKSTKTCTKTKE